MQLKDIYIYARAKADKACLRNLAFGSERCHVRRIHRQTDALHIYLVP
jgi:hypothetical protein